MYTLVAVMVDVCSGELVVVAGAGAGSAAVELGSGSVVGRGKNEDMVDGGSIVD